MVEHLPPDTAWHRERHGPFGNLEVLVLQVESRLRDLLAVESTALAAIKAGLRVKGADPQAPKYLPIPPAPGEDTSEEETQLRSQERTELAALVHRGAENH